MANITSPQAVKFSNEYLRRLGNTTRDMKIILASAATEFALLSGVLATHVSADKLIDGAEIDGRTVVDKGDIVAFLQFLGTLITTLDAAGTDELIAKFSVGAPRV